MNEPTTAEELADLRAAHYRGRAACSCGAKEPCALRCLIADVDTLQDALAKMIEERDAERLVHHHAESKAWRLNECCAAQQERAALAALEERR